MNRRQRVMAGLSLIPGKPPAKRNLDDWRRLRKLIVAEVKSNLADGQPAVAIRKLTRALVEDPLYTPYVDLLRQAVALKRRRRLASAKRDSWADVSLHDQQAALQLESFTAYVQELDALVAKAGLASYAPPVARRDRQSS